MNLFLISFGNNSKTLLLVAQANRNTDDIGHCLIGRVLFSNSNHAFKCKIKKSC